MTERVARTSAKRGATSSRASCATTSDEDELMYGLDNVNVVVT